MVITINDLVINNAGLRKFVADFTTSEVVYKQELSGVQIVTDEMSQLSKMNRTQRNPNKCKELRISFSKHPKEFRAVKVDNISREVIDCGKLQGLTIRRNLTLYVYICELAQKTSRRQ